jgi:hypothetical protein
MGHLGSTMMPKIIERQNGDGLMTFNPLPPPRRNISTSVHFEVIPERGEKRLQGHTMVVCSFQKCGKLESWAKNGSFVFAIHSRTSLFGHGIKG